MLCVQLNLNFLTISVLLVNSKCPESKENIKVIKKKKKRTKTQRKKERKKWRLCPPRQRIQNVSLIHLVLTDVRKNRPTHNTEHSTRFWMKHVKNAYGSHFTPKPKESNFHKANEAYHKNSHNSNLNIAKMTFIFIR